MGKNQDWVVALHFAEQPKITLGEYQKAVKTAHAAAAEEIKKVSETQKTSEPLTNEQKDDLRFKHIFKALVDTVQPKIQELLVREEVNRQLRRLGEQLQQLHIEVDDYLTSRKMTREELYQEYMGMALATLQIEFIQAAIAKEQNLTVSDQELEEQLKAFGSSFSKPELAEYRSYVYTSLLKQKVLKFLLSLG